MCLIEKKRIRATAGSAMIKDDKAINDAAKTVSRTPKPNRTDLMRLDCQGWMLIGLNTVQYQLDNMA